MAKAYWIANVTITDPEAYRGYQAHAPAAFAAHGARFLVRGGAATPLEGQVWQRHVVIEFDSRAQALACYHSEAYQHAKAQRAGACIADIVIVDGTEPS